jgi:lipoyl(octanoyl) transferase
MDRPSCYRAAVETAATTGTIRASWLGRIEYRRAWELQRRLAAARADERIGDQLLLLEHPAVLTLGRQADESHIRVGRGALEQRGIEVIRVERGGEVTYHGPGQLVAYPILGLSRRGLLLRPLVRALEAAMAATCAAFGVGADRREGHPGCWCDPDGSSPRKIGALGIRVERGVSYHGVALNVDPDLRDFDLIDACGMPDVLSTSIRLEGGRVEGGGATAAVAAAAAVLAPSFAGLIGAGLEGPLPPVADPATALEGLERLLAGRAA